MICRICEDETPASDSGLCIFCESMEDHFLYHGFTVIPKPNWKRSIVFWLVVLIGGTVVLWMAGAVFTNVVAAIRGMMA